MQSLKLNLRIDVIVQIDKNISPGGLGTRLIDDMYTQLQLLSFMLFSQCRHRHHTLNMCHQYFLFFLRRSVPTLEMEAARDWWHTQLQSLTIILFSWRKKDVALALSLYESFVVFPQPTINVWVDFWHPTCRLVL